jgi:ribosomal-protein-alanine N-acetyltransferase
METDKSRVVETHIRWMIRRDMPGVLAIEAAFFGKDAWDEEAFLRCLRRRNCIGMTVEEKDTERVIGYMVYELHKAKLHVINLAVEPRSFRQGVGRVMIDKLVSKLSNQRRNRISVDVRERNLGAQLFFKSCGFQAVRVDRGYFEGEEDAYRMVYHLPPEPACDPYEQEACRPGGYLYEGVEE